ncbi:hypothetical protein ACLOJK_036984 [Asimina triloba]
MLSTWTRILFKAKRNVVAWTGMMSSVDRHAVARIGILCTENRIPIAYDRNVVHGPAAGTVAGGATVASRRHRDCTRPATGSHNPQAV